MKRETWISDMSNRKVKQIKDSFQQNLQEQSKDSRINYYDFLLVAKKMSFRFQQSSHLMALKNFFSKNKNSILIKKLGDALSINQQSLNSRDDKIIVKFSVPENDFAPIKEVTNEDEEEYFEDDVDFDENKFEQVGSSGTILENEEINEKMTIILSIKMEEMQRKIKLLLNQFHYPNIFTVFDDYPHENITFDVFRSKILTIIADIKDKLRMSEDDIKTIFYVLDDQENGYLTMEKIERLKNIQEINERMKGFYHSRINKEMVKNTLFKLGKVKNSSIQIYQLKNASVLEFQQIQDQIVDEPINRSLKRRIPHFGPLKGAAKWKKNQRHYNSTDLKYTYGQSSLSNAGNVGRKNGQIDKERERIEKILKNSKEEKKRDKHGDTVASKLRSLFIHKVILPREKMLEEEKQKYGRGKQSEYQLAIRPLKDTR